MKINNFISRLKRKVFLLKTKEENILNYTANEPALKQSVLFFNHHKCASTFTNSLLAACSSSALEHINYSRYLEYAINDYAKRFENHEDVFELYSDLLFNNKGRLYGPLRRPFYFPGMGNYKAVFFVRDPRDAIISYYYSMGYSHKPPNKNAHLDRFNQQRQRIRNMTIDEYALGEGREIFLNVFEGFKNLYGNFSHSPLVVTYDLFRANPSKFVDMICEYIDAKRTKRLNELVERSYNIKGKGIRYHVRSGVSRQFESELDPKTSKELTDSFESYLKFFRLAEYY